MEKKIKQLYTPERILEALAGTGIRVSGELPEKIVRTTRINLLCPMGHDLVKRADHTVYQNLGCPTCNTINARNEMYQKWVQLIESTDTYVGLGVTLEQFHERCETYRRPSNGKKVRPYDVPIPLIQPDGKMSSPRHFSSIQRSIKTVPKPRRKPTKRTQEEAEAEALENGFELLETFRGTQETIDGKAVMARYRFKCIECGYSEERFANNVFAGHAKCRPCESLKVIAERPEKLKQIHQHLQIPPQPFSKSNDKTLVVFCEIHQELYTTAWYSLFDQKKCPCKSCSAEANRERGRETMSGYDMNGEANPSWKGGYTPIEIYLRGKIDEWKIISRRKYGFKCFVTGEVGSMPVHHLNGFNEIVRQTLSELELEPLEVNQYTDDELQRITKRCLQLHIISGFGVPLSEAVHSDFHSAEHYGKGNNTLEQFVEYLIVKGHSDKAVELQSKFDQTQFLLSNYKVS